MKKHLLHLTFMMLGLFTFVSAKAQVPCMAGFTFSVSGNTVTFTNTSTGGVFPSYTWNFGDGNYGYNTNEIHTYASPAMYYVCLTMWDSSGCNNMFCDTLSITTGIFEQALNEHVSIYPNPATENFTVSIDKNFQQAQVMLMDMLGNVVMTRKTDSENTAINVETLASGIYNLMVKADHQTFAQRVVVAH